MFDKIRYWFNLIWLNMTRDYRKCSAECENCKAEKRCSWNDEIYNDNKKKKTK